MKNFTKKLALLLVFAMVLGVVTPTSVARAAAGDFTFNYDQMYFQVKGNSDSNLKDFEYAQYIPKTDAAPTDKEAKEIKDKDWIAIDSELNGDDGKADMSWFNKKKDSYVIVRELVNGAYKYYISGKINAQTPAIKVAFVNKDADKASTKLPAYTATDVVGSKEAGYLLFYKAGASKNTFVVVTPSSVSYRYENGHKFYSAEALKTTLGKFLAKGATFLFSEAKLVSANDTTANSAWPTAETKYKYVAQKNAPNVKLGIDHLVPLKVGQEYRIVDATNTANRSEWMSVDENHTTEVSGKKKVDKVYLEQLIVSGSAMSSFANADKTLKASAIADGKVKLQVRTASTAKGVASKVFSTVVSQKAIDTDKIASVASIEYAVSYDKTKGVKVKNLTKDDIEYCLSTTTSAVALSNKWKAVKAEKETTIKATEIKDTKKNVEYKYILVRKTGDKKAGLLASNFGWVEINNTNLKFKAQEITKVDEKALDGNNKVKYSVTTAGAVTVKVTVANVSEDAISAKIPVTVSNMVKPDIKKWDKKGSAKGYTIDVPEYKTDTITFEFKVEKGQTEGNSGDYKVKVEGLEFTFKVEVTK